MLQHGLCAHRLFDVLAAEPMNGNATMCMGLVCFGLKKYNEAKEMFTRTLEISPRDESALYNLAVVHKQLGNCSGAVKYFSTLLTLRPDHPKAPTELGTCYLQMKEWKKGREIFEKVLRKDPTNKVALNNLGELGAYIVMTHPSPWQLYLCRNC